jgi:multicomponent K+:H+ antiporter subunit D
VTALVLAVVLLPLAAAPLPAWLRRTAGLEPAWPALGAALAALALVFALLPAARSGAAPLAVWPWLPALGLGLALRVDAVAVGFALVLTAGSVLAIAAARVDRRAPAAPSFYGRALALTGATLGAVLADDVVLLWLCLELAAFASALLVAGDGSEAPRRRVAVAALVVMEAGGLALLTGLLLIADVAGSFRMGAALAAAAELRAQPLHLPMVGLVLAGAATRLAPWLACAGQRAAALPAGAALATALFVPLRFAPLLGGSRSWLALLIALGSGAGLLIAWQTWRRRTAQPAAVAAPGSSLLEEFALAARIVWQPLLAPRPALSLTTLGAGAALAVALAAGTARPGAWPGPLSSAWPIVAGSSWLLLAVAAGVARGAAIRILGLAAGAALLLLASFAPPAVVAAELAAGSAALWLVGRALGSRWPARPTLLIFAACLASAAAVRLLLALAPGALTAGYAGHGAAPAGFAVAAPVALPLAAAVALFALGAAPPALKRSLAGVALLANLALAAGWLRRADAGPPFGFAFGAGPTPFGVHLLLDRLAAVQLLIGAVVAALVFGHACGGDTQRRPQHFHALCQLLVCGIAGAVLAADLVDLFVFLEVALLAFNLLLPDAAEGGHAAARAHMALTGAAGSGLFLIAAGCIYAALGTFGFADLALRAPALAAGKSPLLSVAAYLLLVVFALRAAALPFGFWLARASEAAPVAAAFAVLLAEVGCYAILRVYALVFPCFGAGPCGPSGLVLPLGLATLAAGGVGALAASGPSGLRAPLLAVALGTVLVGVGSFREAGFAAAVYLLAPAALGGVALALVGDFSSRPPGAAAAPGTLGVMALLAALGLPPSATWAGRIGILAAAGPDALVVWSLVLGSGLIAAMAAARAAGEFCGQGQNAAAGGAPAGSAAAGCALALLAALALAAGPLYELAGRTARQLLDRQAYVAAFGGIAAEAEPR